MSEPTQPAVCAPKALTLRSLNEHVQRWATQTEPASHALLQERLCPWAVEDWAAHIPGAAEAAQAVAARCPAGTLHRGDMALVLPLGPAGGQQLLQCQSFWRVRVPGLPPYYFILGAPWAAEPGGTHAPAGPERFFPFGEVRGPSSTRAKSPAGPHAASMPSKHRSRKGVVSRPACDT